jgi:hypothetical protein
MGDRQRNNWAMRRFSFDAPRNTITLLLRSAAASGPLEVFFLAQREPTFGFNRKSAAVAKQTERLIFDSAILDFVITTIRLFEIQKVEVSEN